MKIILLTFVCILSCFEVESAGYNTNYGCLYPTFFGHKSPTADLMYENLQAQGRLNRISCSIEISFHQNKNPQKLYPPITTNENLSSDELSKLTKTIGCEDNTVEYKLKHLETSYDSAHSKLLFSLKTQSQHGVKQKSKLRQCYTAPGNTEL